MKKAKAIKIICALLSALLLLAALLVLSGRRTFKVSSVSGFSMNTPVHLSAAGPDPEKLDAALQDALRILENLNDRLSLYQEDSLLSEVNKAGGLHPVQAGPEISTLLKEAAEICKLTGGSFNPLVGPLTRLWKINKREQGDYTLPTQASLDDVLPLVRIENLSFVSPDQVFLRQKGCTLDLGGIAKGYASLKIARHLASQDIRSALIDLGGNIFALGAQPDGSPWKIGVRNPLDPGGDPIAALAVKDAAVITSGSYERYRIVDGKRYSHLFNPATGYPVENDLRSATVVSPNATLADALATALMVMGLDRASDFLESFLKEDPSLGVILVHQTSDGPSLAVTANLEDRLKVLSPGLTVTCIPK
ncbi:MAG: FAD:protein FMN transferase [Fretibacterium sp.]|nr:FAD:protein FMN transferase [Fretibacterium sp.]